MKNINILMMMLLTNLCFGQINSAFSYQGLLIDENGVGIKNTSAEFIISISEHSDGSSIYYQETQNVETDDNGVFDFQIGNGDPLAGNMSDVAWLASVPFIGVQYDLSDGQGMRDLGYTKFQSVPFCFYSKYVVCQKGPEGFPGLDGPSGASGADGGTGQDGAPGINGTNGVDGQVGAPSTEMLDLAPSIAEEGTVYLDNGNNRDDGLPGFRYYDGTNWLDL